MARQIRIRGHKELQAELSKLVRDIAGEGRKAGPALKEVCRDAAEVVKSHAQMICPVKTGKLRSAIFASRGDVGKPSAIVGVNYRIAPHAHLVEFGHAGPHPAGPKPYMRPAVEANRTNVRRVMTDGVTDIVKKYK